MGRKVKTAVTTAEEAFSAPAALKSGKPQVCAFELLAPAQHGLNALRAKTTVMSLRILHPAQIEITNITQRPARPVMLLRCKLTDRYCEVYTHEEFLQANLKNPAMIWSARPALKPEPEAAPEPDR